MPVKLWHFLSLRMRSSAQALQRRPAPVRRRGRGASWTDERLHPRPPSASRGRRNRLRSHCRMPSHRDGGKG